MYSPARGSNQLLRLDIGTGAVTVLNNKLVQPTGIGYATDGDLLVLEINSVRKLDRSRARCWASSWPPAAVAWISGPILR